MEHMILSTLSAQPEPRRFVRRVLRQLRWLTVLVLLLITFLMPTPSSIGLATWVLVSVFAGYDLLLEFVHGRWPDRLTFLHMAVLDILVTGVLYALGNEPGGPLFLLFVLAVDSVAARLSLRTTLQYTAAVGAIAIAIDLESRMWLVTAIDARLLAMRVVMLALVGAGMAIVMRRLVLEQAAAQSNRDQAERLEHLDQLRADFIAHVSHDLRTPLTATRAGLGLLEISALNRLRPDEQHLLGNVRRNTERLNILIDDLLTFNQLEADAFQLDREPLDLRAVIHDAVLTMQPLITEKQQTLTSELPDLLPGVADARRFEQVLVNVLANAHYHTPIGSHITVTGCTSNAATQIIVHDNGPGIPLAEREAVFQRFYRLPLTSNGNGLGLAIAKRVVELHGGRIWIESTVGQGAAVHIELPRMAIGGV